MADTSSFEEIRQSSGVPLPKSVGLAMAGQPDRLEDARDQYGARGLWIPPPILSLLCGTGMWLAADYFPVWMIIPMPWHHFGLWMMNSSAVAAILAFVQFRRAHTTVNPISPSSATALVTSGIYAWTRNPMYLSLAVLLCGWAIRLGALLGFLGPVVFVIAVGTYQIPAEERALQRLFDGQYERYRRKVGRWFGRRSGTD